MSTSKVDEDDAHHAEGEEGQPIAPSGFAQRVLSLRRQHEPLNAFAKRIGVSRSQMNNWRTEQKPDPKISMIIRICDATGADLRWLVTGEGERDGSNPTGRLMADVAVAVKTVEEAVLNFGWTCSPEEKATMVLGVLTEMQQRGAKGENPYDFSAILALLRRVHAAHEGGKKED